MSMELLVLRFTSRTCQGVITLDEFTSQWISCAGKWFRKPIVSSAKAWYIYIVYPSIYIYTHTYIYSVHNCTHHIVASVMHLIPMSPVKQPETSNLQQISMAGQKDIAPRCPQCSPIPCWHSGHV